MKAEDSINIDIILQNNSPVEEFLGLSPNGMHALIYDTLEEGSPIQFRDNITDDIFDQVPLFRLLEEYLKILQREKQIKLTPLGALPRKVVIELYEKRFITHDIIESGIAKINREHDCMSVLSARLTAEIAGLVRKANGKLTLTKNTTKLLKENNRNQLFKKFLQAFTDKFLWSYNDGYAEQPVAQLGWAFSAFMLYKLGGETRQADFYASRYLKAFPTFISFFKESYSTPEDQFIRCYTLRTFDRFMVWFGLVTLEIEGKYNLEGGKVTGTGLLEKLFTFEEA
ncbi:MAG: hypothetical protein ABIN94_21080 [Ferruginibacter sp.]